MKQEKKNALKSIIFYVIAILTIVVINASGKFKSGPCTPNLDVLSVFAVVALNVILLIVNIVKAFVMKKQTRLSVVVHFVALLIWVIVFNCKMI
ncbi:hypothetical protein [Chryseobacterium formosus]|uniref:hypothetical protein n=1 Tax=Chryseobacterium formosus TaxID=1537363 RepID=UPI0022644BB0|nr:hypothetical protein [Chryseobacterium formosus]